MKKILAFLVFLVISTVVLAEDLYFGAGVGAGWNNVQSPDAVFRVDGGVNFSDSLAMEIGTTKLTQSGSSPNQGMQYYDLSLKASLSMTDALGVFFQFGGAYGSPDIAVFNSYTNNSFISSQTAGWSFLTSMGLQAHINRQVAVTLTDYYYYGAPNPQGNTNALLAGAKFNF